MSLNDKAGAALRRELAKAFPERPESDAGHDRLADAIVGKPTHTPGDWIVHIEKQGGKWEYQIRTAKPHNPAGGLGKHIATCNAALEARGEQNARLIAAAPELLEACRAAIPALIHLGNFMGNEFAGAVGLDPYDRCKIIGDIRAAIARAEGGAA